MVSCGARGGGGKGILDGVVLLCCKEKKFGEAHSILSTPGEAHRGFHQPKCTPYQPFPHKGKSQFLESNMVEQKHMPMCGVHGWKDHGCLSHHFNLLQKNQL